MERGSDSTIAGVQAVDPHSQKPEKLGKSFKLALGATPLSKKE
jgi:hypothetical protein